MTSAKIPASVYIITKNAAHCLRDALESVAGFAEIIVVDSGSDDGTPDVAREYTPHVYHQDWLGFARQKAYALSLCTQEWVLNLDADEQVSAALLQEITLATQQAGFAALSIPFDDRYLYQPNHAWVQQVAKVRFFHRSAGRYADTQVHEGVEVAGEIQQAKSCIIHNGETSTQIKVEKNNLYSSLRAEQDYVRGKKPSVVKILCAFPVGFLRSYLLRRQCMNGTTGFMASMTNGFYAFLKAAKLYELYLTRKDTPNRGAEDPD